jgi:BlaI family transcriptional regulator, penicillinase repressor
MPSERPQPTPAELSILNVLWRRGPSTVREVLVDLNDDRPKGNSTGYTTVLKLMQIMTDKGLVRRDESQRTHVYQAAASEDQTQGRLVRDLLDRAFGGSAQKLVLHALSAKKASPQEIAEIRSLLDAMEKAEAERGK